MKRFTIRTKKACNYFIYDDQAGKSSERKRKRIGVEKISFYKIILAPALPIFLVSLGYITKFLVSRPLKIEKVMRTIRDGRAVPPNY